MVTPEPESTFRSFTKPIAAPLETLDDVDGVATADDVWYQVASETYDEAVGTDQHARMEFAPVGTGC